MPNLIDKHGHIWRIVPGTGLVENEHGDRALRALVEMHYGPLMDLPTPTPGSEK